MGKPSTSQVSKDPSASHSKSTTDLNTTMSKDKSNMSLSIKKSLQEKKKQKSRTQKCIKKVFDRLRNESQETLIVIDDNSLNNTVVKKNDSLIVIDDDVEINNNPCSSTPLRSFRSVPQSTPKPLDDLILSHSKDLLTINKQMDNLTKEINEDSFYTIDLTTDSAFKDTFTSGTVIDLDTTNEQDLTVRRASNAGSISGESDVTVINMNNRLNRSKNNNQMQKFANGIANLNASEKGKLLEMITKEIFNGCNVPADLKNSLANMRQSVTRATETAEDTYIKNVIIGGKPSRNSIGSNIYHPDKTVKTTGLRMVVIDGSNVAMEHGHGRVFSVKGLKICIDYFVRRGHVVKAFVPRFRCKYGKSSDPRLLDQLERQGLVIYTPSREIQGKNITPYDDRYIIQCAAEFDGVIVTGDNYRDLVNENPRWRFIIENRILPFTWVQDMIMFPRDPLGRDGPTLEQFLKHK